MPHTSPLATTCVDYDSDVGEAVPDTRLKVNVAAKRSHPPDSGNKKPVEVVKPNVTRESGYSSRSVATNSSASSVQKSNSASKRTIASLPNPRSQPPVVVDSRRISSQSSPRNPHARSMFEARRSAQNSPECRVPNCQCGQSQNRRPPTLSPLDSGLELNFLPSDQHTDQSPYTPPSLASMRRPLYIQESTLIQPAVSARGRSSASSRARPISYHTGVTPSSGYRAPKPQFPIGYGPPLSRSAYFITPIPPPMQPSPRMSATQPNGVIYPLGRRRPYSDQSGNRPPTLLVNNAQDPSLQQRTSSQYNTRRPTSRYKNRLLISYNQPQHNKDISTSKFNTSSSSSSEYHDGNYDGVDEYIDHMDSVVMPLPKSIPQRRPTLSQSSNIPVIIPTNEEFEMRLDRTGTNLEFAGNMESRTIPLNPNREWPAEPIVGRRPIPRKEVEEVRIRSRQSSHSKSEDSNRGSQPLGRWRLAEETAQLREMSNINSLGSVVSSGTGPHAAAREQDVVMSQEHTPGEINIVNRAWSGSVVEDSVFGDNSSVSSLADTTFSNQGASLSSQSSAEELVTAADELVALLQADKELKPLYTTALTKATLGAESFARNFHRLLRLYAKELKAEAKEPLHHMAAQLAYSRAGYVINAIRKQYDQEYKDRTEMVTSAIHKRKLELLDRYLSRLDRRDQKQSFETGANDDTDASYSDEDDWDNDITPLYTLEQVRTFMISGEAIKNLRRRFKQFVDGPSSASLGSDRKGQGGIDSPSPKQEHILTLSGKDQQGQDSQISIGYAGHNDIAAVSELEDTTPDANPSCGSHHSSIVFPISAAVSQALETEETTDFLTTLQSPESTPGNVLNDCDGFRNKIRRTLRRCIFNLPEAVVASLKRQMSLGLTEDYEIFPMHGSSVSWVGILAKPWLRQTKTVLEALGIYEKEIPLGSQRVRWTCSCGKSLYDDFVELQSGALEELQEKLESESIYTQCDSGNNTSARGRLFRFGRLFSPKGTFSSGRQGNDRTLPNAGCLPTHNPQSGSAISTTNTSTHTANLLYLLLCINSSNFGADLYYERIQHINCDQALFYLLHEIYAQRRNKLKSAISLRTVRSINLVKFAADMSAKVDIYPHSMYCDKTICNCMPPESIVEPAPNSEYRCKPIPVPHIPPIGENYMMHLYSSPGCINPSQLWVYNQFPKRIRGPLIARPEAPAEGWGVHFREGWNWPKIWAVVLIFFLGASFIFGVMYAVLRRDAQSAFGIASYWITAATILLGYLTSRTA